MLVMLLQSVAGEDEAVQNTQNTKGRCLNRLSMKRWTVCEVLHSPKGMKRYSNKPNAVLATSCAAIGI
jgi:hypothetical protein